MLKILQKLRRRWVIDPHSARYIAFNQKKWQRKPFDKKESVILVDLFDMNPLIHCFAYISNYLATQTNSSIAAFHLTRSRLSSVGISERRLEKIYESFGAGLELHITPELEKPWKAAAQEFAEKEFRQFKTKWDVLAISIDGIKIGDFIYDTYLKKNYTIDIKSPRLKKLIYDAYVTFQIVKKYLDERNVKAILTSHSVYISHGILARQALKRNIPIYGLIDNDNLVITDFDRETNYHFKYHRYREIFKTLPDEDKPKFREAARKVLTERMGGAVDQGIADIILEEGRPGLIGYGPVSKEKLLKDTGRPRILVMLNCYFDAPHCYRSMLFPDFWEWICFILSKSEQTDFDWYVKPHPGGLKDNDLVVEALQKKFPKVNFLGRTASNRQILDEGINAMFTVLGTAAHEFAFRGIPVVNGGDNPHINYDFNFHPKTAEELEKFILAADHLKIDIDKAQVEEFFYMHYIHTYKKNDFGARCVDEEFAYQKLGHTANRLSIYDGYIRGDSEEKDRKLKAYFDQYFQPQIKRAVAHSNELKSKTDSPKNPNL